MPNTRYFLDPYHKYLFSKVLIVIKSREQSKTHKPLLVFEFGRSIYLIVQISSHEEQQRNKKAAKRDPGTDSEGCEAKKAINKNSKRPPADDP